MFSVSKRYPEVADYFEFVYQQWSTNQPRVNQSVQKFAEWLGFDRRVVSHWINGRSRPSVENARKISQATGDQRIFVLIDAGATDPLLQYIIANWDKLPPDKQLEFKRLIDEAGQGDHLENNRTSTLRRT